MKNTIIITAEITTIEEPTDYPLSEYEAAKELKRLLKVDDVVVTKVQIFEGTDRDEKTEDATPIDCEAE